MSRRRRRRSRARRGESAPPLTTHTTRPGRSTRPATRRSRGSRSWCRERHGWRAHGTGHLTTVRVREDLVRLTRPYTTIEDVGLSPTPWGRWPHLTRPSRGASPGRMSSRVRTPRSTTIIAIGSRNRANGLFHHASTRTSACQFGHGMSRVERLANSSRGSAGCSGTTPTRRRRLVRVAESTHCSGHS